MPDHVGKRINLSAELIGPEDAFGKTMKKGFISSEQKSPPLKKGG